LLVFLLMAFAKPAARLRHEKSFMIEVIAHQLLQARDEECRLYGIAFDDTLPPMGDSHVIGIDKLMTERMLAADQLSLVVVLGHGGSSR
jgi:hypothetical protein